MTGEGRGREIAEAFAHDRQKLVDYNQRDAELVLEILAHAASGRARHLAEPPDRHAARPRRRQHRVDRLPLPRRAAPTRPRRALGDRAPGRDGGGRRRARLRPGTLHQHPRVRLQEPVPEHHPHLQHRSPDLRPARRDGSGRGPDPDTERRGLPRASPGFSQSWWRTVGRARPRPPRRRPAARPRRSRSS